VRSRAFVFFLEVVERGLISRLNIEVPPREMPGSGSRFGKVFKVVGVGRCARLRFGGGGERGRGCAGQGLVSLGFNASCRTC
jgi:hypothetical protein